jgi:hypothetical protein
MRSNGRVSGLAPSQLESASQEAANSGGAHLLIFRGREKHEEAFVIDRIAPYFRMRWVERTVLKLIPHSMDQFFTAMNQVLAEELEWINTVKPHDESCCLLLPECAFSAAADVQHLWHAAAEAGIERIRLAALAGERFKMTHWLQTGTGARAWVDNADRVFDHRGARHGTAPFPRNWKFSYQVEPGFHYDVTSRVSRAFKIDASDGRRHSASGLEHINIDPHGRVRA